jgi:hypothetical protein
MTPLDAVRVNPEGSDPALTLHVYGAVPLAATSVAAYAAPCWPFAKELVVIVTDTVLAVETVILRAAVATPPDAS